MTTIRIRPATPSDLPTLSHIDDLANSNHPMRKLRFRNTPREERDAILLSAWESHFKNPAFHFFVATLLSPSPEAEEKIAGFLTWKNWTVSSHEEDSWAKEKEKEQGKDEDEDFEEYTKKILKRCEEKYRLGEYHMLDTVVIHPELQRMGIGKKLMEAFMEDLQKESEGRGCVIVSSAAGRGLYKRFGWELIGENVWELRRWGWEQPYISFIMKREVET